MENSFEMIGETMNDGQKRREESKGERERTTQRSVAAGFLRGPQRGLPPLDGSLWSLLILWRELIWIILVTFPVAAKAIYDGFFNIREKSLRDKVVVITGAGNGLGRELSLRLAREGCKIACVDIREKCNRETELSAAAAVGSGERVKSCKCDVSKLPETETLAKCVLRDFGRVDILINNAGVLYGHAVTGGNEESVRRVIDVNLLSNFWMVRSFLPDMQKNKSGHIVFINSGSSINSVQHSSAYCASKSGLSGFAYCVDEELRRNPDYDDIKISSAFPYFIATNPDYVKCWKLRMPPISVAEAARQIVVGIKREYFVFHVPAVRFGYFLAAMIKMMPHEIYKMYKRVFCVDVTIAEKELIFK